MKEVFNKDGDPVCYMDSTAVDKWNEKVPYDTLPIKYTYDAQGN
jgi:hypothetical protein